ncbi:ABC transporter substrate-binding protein [Methanonatronarchaeum sp. AMET-Sl]|uniref:ABC transporter substrate-binding protein n=1 Tax=Methanonatronarchaeum sp. AMET-Sl TaxID=3037654 RepID=UPI00244DA1BE|nr:ABC transporter substrate-binding protein [Methanonatronarchaeum sp. AMET-Sl]WGI17745.1 ABC transporter substrate-binding protein [Methanonatronarchaeum sp. AMET-Sl]
MKLNIGLIRGVCQLPGYVAIEKGFFEDVGLDVSYRVDPTAWLLPGQLSSGDLDFAIMPWTRTVKSRTVGQDLTVVAGSGYEETAVVVRADSDIEGLEDLKGKKISLPAEGGMKDLTTQAFFDDLGINSDNTDIYRMPSGDAAVISFLSGEVDASTNVEPYCTLAVEMGVGRIIARGEDVLPRSPGCSITTSESLIDEDRGLVRDVLKALIRAEQFVKENPVEASEMSRKYIGIAPEITREALRYNQPRLDIRGSVDSMDRIIGMMTELGYIDQAPEKFYDFSVYEEAVNDL